MVTPRKFYLSPTKLVPNSPQPLLYYEGVLAEAERHTAGVNEIFDKHGWEDAMNLPVRTNPAVALPLFAARVYGCPHRHRHYSFRGR